MAQLSKVLKVVLGRQRPFPPSVPAEAGCLFNCCGRCSCVFIRGEPVSSYFSMACCSVVSVDVNNVCL